MSATTDKLVIPSIEDDSFNDQFSDDIDFDYNEKGEFAKAITFYVNRVSTTEGATKSEIIEYYLSNR